MREDVYRKMAEHVIEGLKKRNMEGIYCENGEEAARDREPETCSRR